MSQTKNPAQAARFRQNIISLQVLRALAATSVVFQHIPIIGIGSFGVDIFFIISGFIISYVTYLESNQFFIKRVARVVPLYWLATGAVFVVALVMPEVLNATVASGENLIKSLLFIPYIKANNAMHPMLFLGWTLNYEMFFYAVFAIALLVSRRHARYVAAMVLLAIVTIGQLASFNRGTQPVLYFYSDPILLEFVFGIAAFEVWRRFPALFAAARVTPVLIGMALLYAGFLYLQDTVTFSANRPLVFGVPALAFTLLTLSLEGKVAWPLPLRHLGDASYSLYLLHPYVLQTIDKKIISLQGLTATSAIASAFGLALCFAVAWASFRIIERPSNRLIRRLAASLTRA